jgi:hypothetical protein
MLNLMAEGLEMAKDLQEFLLRRLPISRPV